MKKIRTIICDDSAASRKILRQTFAWDPVFEIVAEAADGKEALALVEKHRPDFLTLDIEMPEMDGLAVLEQLMSQQPFPIAMLTSVDKRNADKTLDAIKIGAVDYIPKTHIGLRECGPARLQLLSRLKEEIWGFNKREARARMKTAEAVAGLQEKEFHCLVLFAGAGGGGTIEIQRILMEVPEDYDLPIYVLMPMSPYFSRSYTERCDTLSKISVFETADRQVMERGCAYVARGEHEIGFERLGAGQVGFKVQATSDEAVDVLDRNLMHLAECFGSNLAVIVLSGSGSDGQAGLRRLHAVGADLVVESEESCLITEFARFCRDEEIGTVFAPLGDIAGMIVVSATAEAAADLSS